MLESLLQSREVKRARISLRKGSEGSQRWECPLTQMPGALCNPNCQPRQLTINLISKPSFQGQVWQKGVWQRRKCFKGEAATPLGSIQLWHAAWRVVLFPDSPQLNEIERGPRRVNLPLLEEGPSHEGEENNLCEGQNKEPFQKRNYCTGARRMICPQFSLGDHFLDLQIFT